MKFESIHNLTLPKIGFGTWKIGGGSSPNPSIDPKSLAAIRTALETGYTHFDTAEMYAGGHCEELLGMAIDKFGVKREAIFITTKVKPSNLRYNDVLKSCERSLQRLRSNHIDLYLIHWPGIGINYEDTFQALNKLVREGKVKHLGVSNFNLKLLKLAQSLSETPIITNQVPYSLSDRSYVRNGVLEHCQQNDILLTAYEPVDKGHLQANGTIEEIAKNHQSTIFQIALAWLKMQPRVIAIPMSFNPHHIRENFEAADIDLRIDEMHRLSGTG